MKVTGGNGANVNTTGTGRVLDIPDDPWILARVETRSSESGHYRYDLVEVVPVRDGYGYEDKPGGLVITHAWEINDAEIAENSIVLCRFRSWTDAGPTYEIFAFTGSSSTTGFTGVRPYLVSISCVGGEVIGVQKWDVYENGLLISIEDEEP